MNVPDWEGLGLSLLPPLGERIWTLNAVKVPDRVDEAAIRRRLLDEFSEIGAGLGYRAPAARSSTADQWRADL